LALLLIDVAFFSANAIKLLQGGWFPIVIALASFTTLTTWRRGRQLLFKEMGNLTMPLDQFIQSIENRSLSRISSTAVYLTSRPEGAPSALLHNIKHNEVLHARNVLVTVLTAEVPSRRRCGADRNHRSRPEFLSGVHPLWLHGAARHSPGAGVVR
jgi:KUP system potassium uptake protein